MKYGNKCPTNSSDYNVPFPWKQLVGENGTYLNKIVAGTVSACVPVVNASATNSGSMAVTNASAGDYIFFTGSNANSGVMIYAACITADGAVTASYMNPTGTDTTASTLSFQYLVVGI